MPTARVCAAVYETADGYGSCRNEARSARLIRSDGWGIVVWLCPAHDTLWSADISPAPVSNFVVPSRSVGPLTSPS